MSWWPQQFVEIPHLVPTDWHPISSQLAVMNTGICFVWQWLGVYLLVYMWYMWCGCVSNEEHKIDAYEQTSRSWIDSRLGMGRFRTRQLHLLPPADSINPAGPSHCLLVCMYVRIYVHTYIHSSVGCSLSNCPPRPKNCVSVHAYIHAGSCIVAGVAGVCGMWHFICMYTKRLDSTQGPALRMLVCWVKANCCGVCYMQLSGWSGVGCRVQCILMVRMNSFVRSWRRPMWPKRPAIGCLIDYASYLLIEINSPVLLLSTM